MHTIFHELRYALRQLRKSPGFTAIALLTLALGIGANTAIFSVVNAALLRSLPYSQPDRLIYLCETRTAGTFDKMEFSYPDYVDFRARNQSFSDVGGYSGTAVTYSGKDGAEKLFTTLVSANFFDVLGVRPLIGRAFLADGDLAGGEKAVLLSYAAWQRRFGGDPTVLGKLITLNGVSYSIIGVLPPEFHFAPSRSSDFFLPLEVSGWRLRRNAHWIFGVGRLKPGVTYQQANTEAGTIARQLEAAYPDSNPGVGIALAPLSQQLLGSVRPVLVVLMAAVAAVLLITCSNLGGLQLARSVARRKEIAVRSALGASRRQIIRLLLTESILVAVAGGIAGILLAYSILPLLIASLPTDQLAVMPFLCHATIDTRVLCFSAAASILSGVVFGIIPALQGSSSEVGNVLQDESRTTAGSLRHRLRNALVVTQIALAIVLLTSAGLLLKSLARLLRVDPGFTVSRLLTFDTSPSLQRYSDETSLIAFERNLRARLKEVPGVKSAATVSVLPISNGGGTSRFVLAGQARDIPAEQYEANTREISPNYFATMGIPLLAGRVFDEHDDARAPRVVIVNQTLAKTLFPGRNPIGKGIDFTYTKTPLICQIVGVVGDENVGQLDRKPNPVIYDPYAQSVNAYMGLVIRTSHDPDALSASVRTAVHELDPGLPIDSMASMEQIIDDSPSVAMRKYPAYVIGAFAALALALAMLGVYGLLAFVVAQRTRELGIRLALGAQRQNLLRLVITAGLKLALLGTLIGILASLLAGRTVATMLFQVRTADAPILLAVAGALMLVALLASYLPARRAASLDPMQALRME